MAVVDKHGLRDDIPLVGTISRLQSQEELSCTVRIAAWTECDYEEYRKHPDTRANSSFSLFVLLNISYVTYRGNDCVRGGDFGWELLRSGIPFLVGGFGESLHP